MSDEGRRVFPMETALGVVAGKGGDDVLDFMGYALNRSVDEDCRPAVNPMVKGWLFSLNPDFLKSEFNDNISYDSWVAEQKRKLGDNVSIQPMSEGDLSGINALFDTVAEAKQLAEDKEAEAAEALAAQKAAEAEAKALAPFKKKAEDLEAKVAALEEKVSALNGELSEAKAKAASFDGKVAVDETGLEKAIKDIVQKAVGGLVAAGGAAVAAGAAEGGEAAAPADDFGAAESSVPDSFGFGASGNDGDGFGF